jgi:hypothetical protein
MQPKDYNFSLKLSDKQINELKTYLDSLTPEMILFGLRFVHNRQKAVTGRYLMPGRKSMIKKETHMLSHSQAKWRLDNWKAMIHTYREKGYSYPTISRIKREVSRIANNK